MFYRVQSIFVQHNPHKADAKWYCSLISDGVPRLNSILPVIPSCLFPEITK